MHGLVAGIVIAALLALPGRSFAQPQTATITGTVRDSATGVLLSLVSVSVIGTAFGAVTGSDGRYRIGRVPLGSIALSAKRVGYSSSSIADVLVDTVGSYVRDIALSVQALILTEVVQTGFTGPWSSRRTCEFPREPGVVYFDCPGPPPGTSTGFYGSPLEILGRRLFDLHVRAPHLDQPEIRIMLPTIVAPCPRMSHPAPIEIWCASRRPRQSGG